MVNHLVTINNVIAQVGKLEAEVEKVRDRFQTEYDDLPFETQDSEYGEELKDAIDALEAHRFPLSSHKEILSTFIRKLLLFVVIFAIQKSNE